MRRELSLLRQPVGVGFETDVSWPIGNYKIKNHE